MATAFLDWLQTSPDGQAAAAEPNNHGTWYDAEVASLALYLGRTQTAQQVVSHYAGDQEAKQISPTGAEPLELAGTNLLDYSTFNLDGAMMLSLDARYVGVELFDCTPSGAGASPRPSPTCSLTPPAPSPGPTKRSETSI